MFIRSFRSKQKTQFILGVTSLSRIQNLSACTEIIELSYSSAHDFDEFILMQRQFIESNDWTSSESPVYY